MKNQITVFIGIIFCSIFSHSYAQTDSVYRSKINYMCRDCAYDLIKSTGLKTNVVDINKNSYKFYIYQNSGIFCEITSSRNQNLKFQIVAYFVSDVGYIEIDNKSSNILVVTFSGGSGGSGHDFYLINLESFKVISLSYFQFGQKLPTIERSSNFYELKNESEFIDNLKYEYGYIDSTYIEKNINNPDRIMETWKYYNDGLENGLMKTFNFSEIPNFYLENGSASIELDNNKYTFRTYHKSGVIAFDKINKTYFVIFVPRDSYCWILSMIQYKDYLLLGTRGEGFTVINLNTLEFKRIDMGKANKDVKKISVEKNHIIINDSKDVTFEEF